MLFDRMRGLFVYFALLVTLLPAADPLAAGAQHKLDLIESGHAKPGSVMSFTPAEINAWAGLNVRQAVPEGVRNPRVDLGQDTAAGYILVDFLKMRSAKGVETNFLISKLIEGERPVQVSIRLESGGGQGTVYLTSVAISNVTVSGSVLDFLVKTFFMPLFPDAKIGEPFALAAGIERIDIRPTGVQVVMKNSRPAIKN